MAVDARITGWSGYAYRHIPAGMGFDVLDFRFAGRAANNRWNATGEPTLYLAADRGVAIAEFARHLKRGWPHVDRRDAQVRELFRLHLSIERLLDLRDPDVSTSLAVQAAPHQFLEQGIARSTAHLVRNATPAQAIIVPSMAFLDDPARWVAVLFLEKLPADPRAFVTAVEPAGVFRLGE